MFTMPTLVARPHLARTKYGRRAEAGAVGTKMSKRRKTTRASTLRVHHRKIAWQKRRVRRLGLQSDHHRKLPRVAASTRRLVVVRFHKPFWRRVEAQEGNEKSHFPRSREMAPIASDCSRIPPQV